MKLRKYLDPFESQTHIRISEALADNISLRIHPCMPQVMPMFYGKLKEEPYEFLEEFLNIFMTFNYPSVS